MNMLTVNDIEELKALYQDENWLGECFLIAYRTCKFFAAKDIDIVLVHANIDIDGKTMSHAWVEYNELVIDLTQEVAHWIVDKNLYYEQAKISKIIKYNIEDILLLIRQTGKEQAWADWLIFNTE